MGRVREEGRVPQEEGLRGLDRAGDEGRDRREAFATDAQALVPVPAAAGRVAVGHAVGEAAVRVGALPPLAGLVGEVAGLTEQPHQVRVRPERVLDRHGGRGALLRVDVVGEHTVLVGVQAGRDRGQGRTAERTGHVPAREHQAARRERIQVRGLEDRMPEEAVVAVALIVRDDQQDVGSRCRVLSTRGRGEEHEQQAEEGARHDRRG